MATLRLLINGRETVLPMCQSHADWVAAYIEEDTDVRLADCPRKATQKPSHKETGAKQRLR